MHRKFLTALLLLTSIAAFAATDSHSDAFRQLLVDHWTEAEAEKLFFRTDPDAFRPDGILPDVGPDGRARRKAFNQNMLERLAQIDEDALTGQEKIS